jgi:fluoride exporter
MAVVFAVGLGGALGASARYGVDRFIEHRVFTVFPWSTFVVNTTGCFAAGLVIASLVDRHHLPLWLRAGLVMGVLGGYTTFSTYAQESLDLIEERQLALALAYSLGSVVIGVTAALMGTLAGRAL